jgi:predicted O-linked N-acetylglucosamine transferase (SPINDLY family)
VTCAGRTFAARVAGSLLRAAGLAELVTTSLAEYEQLALSLALDPGRLSSIRATLETGRDKLPLFDTPRFTRNLEAVYRNMWERHQRGEAPASFRLDSSGQVVGLP